MKLTRKCLINECRSDASAGAFYLADNCACMDELLKTYAGQVKVIYMDPPYMTGEKFHMRVRVGENDWVTGRSSLVLNTYVDTQNREVYIQMMREVLKRCHALLRPDGMIFLHIDYRVHPYMRLLMDEVFGEDNFLNEIIWAYQSGGRSLRHFSRKHDVILFYAKGPEYDFNVSEVLIKPEAPRTNHMRRHVDPDGRVYRSIRVGGKVYTYYDDDPIAPSDVWADVSHLQQKDPERTGYDTQKPLALLERIIRCSSRAGELVLDPFCGSGTTLEAAARAGRSFIGIDNCELVPNILRRRLKKYDCRLNIEQKQINEEPECEAHLLPGVGFYHVTLDRFETVPGLSIPLEDGRDAIDSWSVGYLTNGEYRVHAEYIRGRKEAVFRDTLDLPAYSGCPALCINDVLGRSFLYEIEPDI